MNDALEDELDIDPVERAQTIVARCLAKFQRWHETQSRSTQVMLKFFKGLQQLASDIKENFVAGIIRIRNQINFSFC